MRIEVLKIRSAMSADAEEIARLSLQLGYPVDLAVMRQRLSALLASPTDSVLIAEVGNGALIGWVHGFLSQLLESELRVEVGGLVVDELFRSRGAGRQLMERLEVWARGLGAQQVSARCNTVRIGSHRFYQQLGYRPTKTQVAFRKSMGSGPL